MDTDERKKMIQQGFDTVAQGYDHPALSFFPETAKRMMGHLALADDKKLLDVCTGTGVVALAAAGQLANGKVTGIDLSSGMLEQARSKAEQYQLNNIEFKQMDLDHLDFPEAFFDIATSSFGLFFLDDMSRGLNNIVKVVKPGGRIAISSFTNDAFSPMTDLFVTRYESFGREVPGLSWKRLSTHELIKELFAQVGIGDVEIHHEPLGYYMTSPQEWWDVVWNAGYRGLLNQLSEEERVEFKVQHLEEIEDLINKDRVWFNTEVLIAIGQK
ncbi:MAG: methyltransferase domain-containing protein [Gammaproteobacteria bacterium]|nr:methyltransferase domain-containing protein [Gammaproteobacteria bacterium]